MKKETGAVRGLRRRQPWVFWGLVFSLLAAIVFMSSYDAARSYANRRRSGIMENFSNISWLYKNVYMLYRDLYNSQAETPLSYCELYFQPDEKYRWVFERSIGDVIDDFSESDKLYGGENGDAALTYEEYTLVMEAAGEMERVFSELEANSFGMLNSSYDYLIEDLVTDRNITNMSLSDRNRGLGSYHFYLTFVFDEEGNVTIDDSLRAEDEQLVRKLAYEVSRNNFLISEVSFLEKYGHFVKPKNCSVTFAISNTAWNHYGADYYDGYYRYYGVSETGFYLQEMLQNVLIAGVVVMALLGFLAPVFGASKPWREVRLCSLPFEALFALGVVFAGLGEEVVSFARGMADQSIQENLRQLVDSLYMARFLALIINIVLIAAYFFSWWYIGVSARAVRDFRLRYIKERCLIYRFFPFVKRKILGVYHYIAHLDLTKDAHEAILKVVLANAAILSVVCCFWFGGIGMVLVYSVILYCVLRKYISDLSEKYEVLLKATNEMAEGRLNISIVEDLGVFEPFKPQLLKIQEGFQKAVEEEVKSQRMKAELITNVSHDLKTPLTAIITYVNLLKEDNVTQEQRKEYLDTLERKSLRLKVLIEDLFEVSKANSNNMTLHIVDVDIMNLVKQVAFEMSDKLSAAGLDVRMNLTDEKIILPLDSQKTYRIFENLFGNVAKYALSGTRVYVNGFCVDERVFLSIKNISAQEITVAPQELTERFVRGDASRNTEGSGLGLAIAQSFVQIQGGELGLEIDGDLFKVTVSWPLP